MRTAWRQLPWPAVNYNQPGSQAKELLMGPFFPGVEGAGFVFVFCFLFRTWGDWMAADDAHPPPPRPPPFSNPPHTDVSHVSPALCSLLPAQNGGEGEGGGGAP